MQKLKTKSSTKRRFKVTASGKIKISRAKIRHNLRRQEKRCLMNKKGGGMLSVSEIPRVMKYMPYSY